LRTFVSTQAVQADGCTAPAALHPLAASAWARCLVARIAPRRARHLVACTLSRSPAGCWSSGSRSSGSRSSSSRSSSSRSSSHCGAAATTVVLTTHERRPRWEYCEAVLPHGTAARALRAPVRPARVLQAPLAGSLYTSPRHREPRGLPLTRTTRQHLPLHPDPHYTVGALRTIEFLTGIGVVFSPEFHTDDFARVVSRFGTICKSCAGARIFRQVPRSSTIQA
jgi:hypothetical protein